MPHLQRGEQAAGRGQGGRGRGQSGRGRGRNNRRNAQASDAAGSTEVAHDSPADDEGSGEDKEAAADQSEDEDSMANVSVSRVGRQMQIQGCDPEECDYVCSECPWEDCIVIQDHGKTCDVKITSDGAVCYDILVDRFLRAPKRQRRV